MEASATTELKRILDAANINGAIVIDDYYDDPKLELLIRTKWPNAKSLLQKDHAEIGFVESDDIDIDKAIVFTMAWNIEVQREFARRIGDSESVNELDRGRLAFLARLFQDQDCIIKTVGANGQTVQ